jgi:hypothetical protein
MRPRSRRDLLLFDLDDRAESAKRVGVRGDYIRARVLRINGEHVVRFTCQRFAGLLYVLEPQGKHPFAPVNRATDHQVAHF